MTEVTPAEPIFPHKATWRVPEGHGLYVKEQLQFDTSICTTCHGASLEGESGPSCHACHAAYPHDARGVSLATHGAAARKTDGTACATACHGTDRQGGLSGVGCTQCHARYPHPVGWKDAASHGVYARGAAKSECALCHGADWAGGASGVGCQGCHAGIFPHPHDWADPAQHGSRALAQGPGACATACHGTALDGGLSKVSCMGCHASYPQAHLATTWKTFLGHGQYLATDKAARGAATAVAECQRCHGDPLTGGRVGKTCYHAQCHTAYPHPVPNFTPWLKRHGAYVVTVEPEGKPTSCATANCHGTDLSGNPANVPVLEKRVKGCSDCHLQYPHPPPKNGTPVWDHGKAVVTNNGLLDVDKCSVCHGSDLTGQGAADSCYACHVTYPDRHRTSGWTTTKAGHGAYVRQHVTSAGGTVKTEGMAECVVCHGSDLLGGAAGKSCYSTCHPSFPHVPPPLSTTIGDLPPIAPFADGLWGQFISGHGSYVADRARAADRSISQQAQVECGTGCHGTGLQTPINGKTCGTCHAHYPHPMPQWIDVTSAAGDNHGEAVIAAAQAASPAQAVAAYAAQGCATAHCHGSEAIAWGNNPCMACHETFPGSHAAAEWKAGAHGADAKVAKEECLLCHGWSAAKTAVGTCVQCHDPQLVYPKHVSGWYDKTSVVGGVHGAGVIAARGATAAGCLTACHGVTGNGGFVDNNFYCTNCHADYPHQAPWLLPSGAGYSPHGKAVVNIADSLDRSDDTFNAANFSACAKCHGPWVLFATAQFALTAGEQYMTVQEGVQLERCTACHRYPHVKVRIPAGTIVPWEDEWGHAKTIQSWFSQQTGPAESFIKQTCGSGGNGSDGCHTGWQKKNKGIFPAGAEALCSFCHINAAW